MITAGDMTSWARRVLESREALVEDEGNQALRAMLTPQSARLLDADEWLSLNFAGGAGADDPLDWLERLSRLLPNPPRLAVARLPHPGAAIRLDAEAICGRELILQNGVFRVIGDSPGMAWYCCSVFETAIESDERTSGLTTEVLNASAHSVVTAPERFLQSLSEQATDNLISSPESELVETAIRSGARRALNSLRAPVSAQQETATRRLNRDAERVQGYYRGLLSQIDRRIQKAEGEKANREKERRKATESDREAKIEDLRRKYAIKVEVKLTDILAIHLPVVEINVRLVRKKEERIKTFHWNPILRTLESPWCESCAQRAHPILLCERMHVVCKECHVPCPACGRTICRACHPNGCKACSVAK